MLRFSFCFYACVFSMRVVAHLVLYYFDSFPTGTCPCLVLSEHFTFKQNCVHQLCHHPKSCGERYLSIPCLFSPLSAPSSLFSFCRAVAFSPIVIIVHHLLVIYSIKSYRTMESDRAFFALAFYTGVKLGTYEQELASRSFT